jgi:hypothetical protein
MAIHLRPAVCRTAPKLILPPLYKVRFKIAEDCKVLMQRTSLCTHLLRRACHGQEQASASLASYGASTFRLGRILVRDQALQHWPRAHLEDRMMCSSPDNRGDPRQDALGLSRALLSYRYDYTSVCTKPVIEPSRQQYQVLHSWIPVDARRPTSAVDLGSTYALLVLVILYALSMIDRVTDTPSSLP